MRLKNDELASTKSNEIIQNYSWGFKEYELKVFEFLCCCYKTQYYDAETNTIRVSLKDFANEVGNSSIMDGGFYYSRFLPTIKKIRDTSIWVHNDKRHLLSIMSGADIDEKDDAFMICQMTDDYKKHMSKYPNGNAFVELKITNSMTSKYSIKLYNLCKSWSGKEEITLDIDYLKNILECTSPAYNSISKLKSIIDKAVSEINVLSKINISYATQKKGKKIQYFIFKIKTNETYNSEINQVKLPPTDTAEFEDYLEENFTERENLIMSVVPEEVHSYDKDKLKAIYSLSYSYVLFDTDNRELSILNNIGRFTTAVWKPIKSKQVKSSNVYGYYYSCFEAWLKNQKGKT